MSCELQENQNKMQTTTKLNAKAKGRVCKKFDFCPSTLQTKSLSFSAKLKWKLKFKCNWNENLKTEWINLLKCEWNKH